MNEKLQNRKKVEKLLGPTVERLTISPRIVKKVSEGPVDEAYVQALDDVQRRLTAIDSAADLKDVKAAQDLKPLLESLAEIVGLSFSHVCRADPPGCRAYTRLPSFSDQSAQITEHQCSDPTATAVF